MNNLPIGTVEFDHVCKRYRLGTLGTLRGAVEGLMQRGDTGNSPRNLWALKDVSFRVERGDSLGLIGPNGAGKTTTLKLLSNITHPTSGSIVLNGRYSSLIELGAGFHPELTGRENIFLNGAILGLSRREIRRKLDEIIAFSELERFIDTPVKRYSSGMYVRLGFAVTAHVEPDILLVDEVLAVGDASFRQKCMKRMELLREKGTTLVFVSHNMYQVRRLCHRALLLIGGRPVFLGDAGEAISTHEEFIQTQYERQQDSLIGVEVQNDITISQVAVSDVAGNLIKKIQYDQPVKIQVQYFARKPMVDPIVKIRLLRSDGIVSAMIASHHMSHSRWTFTNHGELTILLEPVQLTSGSYLVEVRVADSLDSVLLASGQSHSFLVQGPALLHEPDHGVFVPNTTWSHVER